MRRLLFTFLLLIPLLTFSQDFIPFHWKDEDVQFKTVELKVLIGNSKAALFEGYKNATVQLKTLPMMTEVNTVALKLGGYFEMEEGTVSTFSYEVKEARDYISYNAVEGNKTANVKIIYDQATNKPLFATVVASNNFTVKPLKTLTFVLKGFE